VARSNKCQDIVEYLEIMLRGDTQQGYQVHQRRVNCGPAIDNIDIAVRIHSRTHSLSLAHSHSPIKLKKALLSFRSEDGSASTPIRLDRPEEKDIVKYHDEFYFEIGKNDFFKYEGKGNGGNNDLVDLQIERANFSLDTSSVMCSFFPFLLMLFLSFCIIVYF